MPTGNSQAINLLAHEVIAVILSDQDNVYVDRGAVYDIVLPDGQGLRFHAAGILKGFLEPLHMA